MENLSTMSKRVLKENGYYLLDKVLYFPSCGSKEHKAIPKYWRELEEIFGPFDGEWTDYDLYPISDLLRAIHYLVSENLIKET